MLKRVGESIHPAYSNCGWHPFLYVVVVVVCAGRIIVEEFYGADQVGVDVIQPNGCLQSCVSNSVERLLEVHEGVAKVLLLLQVFSQSILRFKILLCCAPSCSETCLSLHLAKYH